MSRPSQRGKRGDINNSPDTDILILLGGLQGVPEVDLEIRNRLEVPSPGFTSSSSSLEVMYNVLSVT